MKGLDVIVIGSGLGGLVCGYMLGREGYSVCVLEKHSQIGGCLQTFRRDGCIFDTGMHYIGSLEEGQILDCFFKYLGIRDKLSMKKLDADCFDRINLRNDDRDYNYAVGYDRFIDGMLALFPGERDAVSAYVAKIREITGSLNLYNFREIENTNIIDSTYLSQSVSGFIDSITIDPKLRNVLAGTNPLYAGVRGKSPIYMHALINNFFIESAYRFVDGGDQLASLLAEEIAKLGGVVITKKEVVSFIMENELPSGVVAKDGDVFHGKYFISNIHPVNTFAMLDSNLVRKPYRARVNAMPNTTSTFAVYATLKERSFRYRNFNYYCYDTDDVWDIADYTEKDWPKGYMLITPATSKSDEWADCATIITYMNWNDVVRWENTSIEKRGDDYLAFKREKAERLLASVEKRFPGFGSKIKKYYTSSPLTYRDYTGTRQGSLYGVMKDCNDPLNTYLPPKTKVPNLFLTGQNVNMHGVLGVMICSLLTCGELAGLNNLIRKVRNA
jgi:all-trans-retinol 13,14-reductase